MQSLSIFLIACVSLVASTSNTPVCTNGFTLINNKCLKLFPNQVSRTAAAKTCMGYGATLVTVKNANDNQAIITIAGSSNYLVWIGIYCFGSDESQCLWDDASGAANLYNIFASGFPSVGVGNCVYYAARGALLGQWFSDQCDTASQAFICELPYTFADACTYNYNGNCYTFHDTPADFVHAQQTCEQECGNLASITSELENRYITTITNRLWDLCLVYLGAAWTLYNQFSWVDGSRWSYNNIDWFASFSSPCMALVNGNNLEPLTPAGSWRNTFCENEFSFICKRPAALKCDSPQPTITPAPSNPSYCNSSMLLGPGIITSPNFPGSYDNNVYCTYQLATLGSYRVALKFIDFETEECCDKVYVYDGDSTSCPLMGTYSGMPLPIDLFATGNRMTVVFQSDEKTNYKGFRARVYSSSNAT